MADIRSYTIIQHGNLQELVPIHNARVDSVLSTLRKKQALLGAQVLDSDVIHGRFGVERTYSKARACLPKRPPSPQLRQTKDTTL